MEENVLHTQNMSVRRLENFLDSSEVNSLPKIAEYSTNISHGLDIDFFKNQCGDFFSQNKAIEVSY